MEHVDLDAARLVGVEGVVAYAEHTRIDFDLLAAWVLKARVAKVDAGRQIRVG